VGELLDLSICKQLISLSTFLLQARLLDCRPSMFPPLKNNNIRVDIAIYTHSLAGHDFNGTYTVDGFGLEMEIDEVVHYLPSITGLNCRKVTVQT